MENFDRGSIAVMGITLTLFAYALVRHALTDALLLEAGIFLVSVKLIMISYENGHHIRHVESQLSASLQGLPSAGYDGSRE